MRIEGKRKDDHIRKSDHSEEKLRRRLIQLDKDYAILKADMQNQIPRLQYDNMKKQAEKYKRYWEIHNHCDLQAGEHRDRGGDQRDRGGDRRDRGRDHRDRVKYRGKDRSIEENIENVETKTRVTREKNKLIIKNT